MIDRVLQFLVRKQRYDLSSLVKLAHVHVAFDEPSVEGLLSTVSCFVDCHVLGQVQSILDVPNGLRVVSLLKLDAGQV